MKKSSVKLQFTISTRCISQEEATNIEQELINEYKFSVDQLTELYGLGVAQALGDAYPLEHQPKKTCLAVIGTGCNGGQGLVCARHLKQYGYSPVLYVQKHSVRPLFINLYTQCELMEIPCLSTLPNPDMIDKDYDFVLDALYGHSFTPPLRPNFITVIDALKSISIPICSIDVPSGWNVNLGRPEIGGINPEMLVSLIAPKKCSSDFHGEKHYLTGRFIPAILQEKYHLNLPDYPGHSQFVRLRPL